jgi:hypothetical protein
MAPRGAPVLAVAEGNVVKLSPASKGLTVYQFDNSRTWCYYYAHLIAMHWNERRDALAQRMC